MSTKKKVFLVISMVAVLAIAAILNVVLIANEQNPDDNSTPVASFFDSTRADRQATREYEIQQLNSILQMEGDEYSEARANALEQKMKLIESMELEYLLETTLKALGFQDAIVTISTTSESINVVVDCDELLREDTAKIYNTITQETSISPDYINIIAI